MTLKGILKSAFLTMNGTRIANGEWYGDDDHYTSMRDCEIVNKVYN